MQESSLRLRFGESSRRIGSWQLSQKRTEGWFLEALKGGATKLLQEGEILWKNTVFISQKSSRRNLIVRILRGGFVKSWKPSDLLEEKEGYGECFSKCKLRRNRVIGFEPTGVIGSLTKSHFGVSEVRELKEFLQDS